MKSLGVLERGNVFDAAPFFTVCREIVRLENDTVIDNFYTIDQKDFVVVFARITPDEILVIQHYKHGVKRIILGLFASHVEEGETPQNTSQRELLDETGYRAKNWMYPGSYVVDVNRECGNAHVFYASELSKIQDPHPDDLEEIKLDTHPIIKLEEKLTDSSVVTIGAAMGVSLGLP